MNADNFDGAPSAPATGHCDDAHASQRLLAVVALRAAQAELERIALASDEPDALSRFCPECGLPAEWPDCESCGHLFDSVTE